MKLRKLLRCLWCSVHLFRVSKVPVQIHTSAIVFPWGFLIISGWMAAGWSGLLAILAVVLLIQASVLAHEFAHVFVARRFGCETRRVLFIPFGCLAELESIPLEPGEIWMAGAGPAASATLAAFFYGCSLLAGGGEFPDRSYTELILDAACMMNIVVAVFNLLPCFPMDGGRILRSLIALIIGRLRPGRALQARLLATRIAVRYIARPLAIAAIVATVLWTHLWHHVIMFLLLIVAGEAEYFMLREDSLETSSQLELPEFNPCPVGSIEAEPVASQCALATESTLEPAQEMVRSSP